MRLLGAESRSGGFRAAHYGGLCLGVGSEKGTGYFLIESSTDGVLEAARAENSQGTNQKAVFVLVISMLRQFQTFNRYASFKSLQTAVSLRVRGS